MTRSVCWCSFVNMVTYPRITFTRGLHGRATRFYLARATNAACRVILWTCVRCWTPIFGMACFLKTCLTCRQRCSSLWADCCICAMPLSILKTIDTDFSPEFKQAIDAASYDSAYKIAWESRRFWERDYRIYGGISFPKQIVGVVWYPSADLFAEKGIIVAGYSIENGTEFANLDLAGKLAASRQAVEHLHPGSSSDLAKPVYISWGHIPYNLGSWISHGGPKRSAVGFDRLLEPDGPIYMAGDHVSHIVRWQEGAAL